MKQKDFFQLFLNEVKEIYNAEIQISKALPNLIHAAKSPKLKEGLKNHLKETEEQIERLKEIGLEMNEDLSGMECEAMKGLLKESQKLLQSHYQPDVLDAAIISAAQKIEHYEIACYGVLKTFAKHLEFETAEKKLKQSLKEESHADTLLTEIAEGRLFTSGVNVKANQRKSA